MKNKIMFIIDFLYQKRMFLLVFFLLFLIISFALCQIFPAISFSPINGTYQNYNVVRRLLDGQTPYHEFVVYLGALHLYFGGFLTFLFGGTYASSVFAFNFLTLLTYSFLIWIIAKSLKYTKEQILLAIVVLLSISCLIMWVIGYTKVICELVTTGNSSRLIRLLVLPLSCFFIMCVDKKIKKTLLKTILYAVIAGIAFPCSNDYGISTCASISFLFLLSLFFDNEIKEFRIRHFFAYFSTLVFSIFSTVTLVSKGHFVDWFVQTKEISSYQNWYFIGTKTLFLYEANLTFFALLQLFLSGFFIYKFFQSKNNNCHVDENLKYKILAILNFSCSIATQLLNYFGDKTFILPIVVLILTLILYPKEYLKKYFVKYDVEKLFLLISICLTFCVGFYNIAHCIKKSDKYVKLTKLGGAINKYHRDILDAKEFIGDEKVFSTYASVLEDVTNQFQPSGYDYIIHVLGDKAREKYLKAFNRQDFKYVTIQKMQSTNCWEAWIRNSNWFFYRELYKNYKPIYTNNYLDIYIKKKKQDINPIKNPDIKIKKINKRAYAIDIDINEKVNGYADVEIDFDIVCKKKFLKIFYFKHLIKVSDAALYDKKVRPIFLSVKHPQIIPATIVNGKARLYVDSLKKFLEIKIKSIKVENYYKTPASFVEIANINNNLLELNSLDINKSSVMKAKKIKIENIVYNVKRVEYNIINGTFVLELDKTINTSKAYFAEIVEQKVKNENINIKYDFSYSFKEI